MPSTQNVDAHWAGVTQSLPSGTGVLVGVCVTVRVIVAVAVMVEVAVAVAVAVAVGGTQVPNSPPTHEPPGTKTDNGASRSHVLASVATQTFDDTVRAAELSLNVQQPVVKQLSPVHLALFTIDN